MERRRTAHDHSSADRSSLSLCDRRPSPWSQSGAKRLFDCVCVLFALPLLVPVLLAIALAVWLTSSGPVLFLQKRMGLHGRTFTILKFRTLIHAADKAHHAVTTAGNQRFTPTGPFLRRWKLDELPQLLNVLWGDMSLVGPRPKMPEHVISNLKCRPGITGAATIAFAREEEVLDRVPKHRLESFYHAVVLPAKRRLDVEYMARATFLSDFKLIVNSVLRRWDRSIMEGLLNTGAFEAEDRMLLSRASDQKAAFTRVPMPPSVDRPAPAEQVAAF
ncbi:MAG: sugar transferase [Terracidiphilus sp.]